MFRNVDTFLYTGAGHSGIINRLLNGGVKVLHAESKGKNLTFRTYSRDRQKVIVIFDTLCYNYKIIRTYGARALAEFLRKRWILPIAACIAVALICLIPHFVNEIRIISDTVDKDEIISVISDCGIKRGAFIPSIDKAAAQRAVEAVEGASFADVVIMGSTVTVTVRGELPPVNIYDVSARGEIVASCDAVITRQLIYSGAATNKAGDVVRAGDVLITSEIPVGDSFVRVYPSGEIYGLVTYTAEKLYTPVRTVREKSGASFTESVVHFLGLTGAAKGSPFPMYETLVETEKSGFLIPLTVKRYTYYEIVDKEIRETLAEAEDRLKEEAYASAQAAVPDGAVVKSRYTTIRQTGAGAVVQAVITVEQRVDVDN